VNSRVLLLALLQDEDSGALRMLATMGVDPVQLETDLSPRAQKDLKELVGAGGRTKKDNGKSMLQQCATDLTEQARLGKLDLVVGRDEEVSRMMRILVRRRKNNPALLGDPGVGKTAIAVSILHFASRTATRDRHSTSCFLARKKWVANGRSMAHLKRQGTRMKCMVWTVSRFLVRRHLDMSNARNSFRAIA